MSTVLIVDDHDCVRRLLVDYFEDQGFTVVSAPSGAQALDRLRERRVDVMLLDMHMPGVGGLETIRRVRHSFPSVGTRIILMSGDYPEVDPQALDDMTQLAGAHAMAYKPFQLSQLLALVREQEGLTAYTDHQTFYLPPQREHLS